MFSFKNYLQNTRLTEAAAYGIPHLEDLPIETFIRSVEKIHSMRAVQKLDGANLQVGCDLEGKLYTSREQKGGDRFYSPKDLPGRSAYDGFRAATQAFMAVKDKMLKVLQKGQACNCEVIFGEQPNTVIYGKDGLSYIAFLDPLIGDDPSIDLDHDLPVKLANALKDEELTTQSIVHDTSDGSSMTKQEQSVKWKFTRSDVVDKALIKTINVADLMKDLQKYLDSDNKAAHQLGQDLSNYDVLKSKGGKLVEERKRLEEEVRDKYKIPVKQAIFKHMGKAKPSLRQDGAKSKGGYNGIEGFIFKDDETNENFKVVDRDQFTAVNKFNYEVRNKLLGTVLTSDESAPLASKGGLAGEAKIRCIRLFSIPNLEISSQAKKALEPYAGNTAQETYSNIAKALKGLSFQSIKRKMGAILTHTLDDIEDERNEFNNQADKIELKLPDGQVVKYTPEIKRRTLMTFAEATKELNKTLKNVRAAESIEALVKVFVDRAVKQLLADAATAEEEPDEER